MGGERWTAPRPCLALEEQDVAGLRALERVGAPQDGAVRGVDVDVDPAEVFAQDVGVADPLGGRARVGADQADRDVVGVELPAGVVLDEGEAGVDVAAREQLTERGDDRADVLGEEGARSRTAHLGQQRVDVGVVHRDLRGAAEGLASRDVVERRRRERRERASPKDEVHAVAQDVAEGWRSRDSGLVLQHW